MADGTEPLLDTERFRDCLRAHVSQELFWEERMPSSEAAKEAENMCNAMMKDDAQLDRILVARSHDEETSKKLFVDQVRFRARWKPQDLQPSDVPNALPSGAWRLCGYSKEGCIVSNYKLEFWDPDAYGDYAHLDEAIDEYTRYILYMMELMIGRMKSEQQFVLIFDLKGFYMTMVTRTNIRLMIRKLIYVAQAQYPERLRKVFLVNAPYGFATAWSMIKVLLDASTAAKVTFATKAMLANDIGTDVLSEAYGGNHPEYPIPTQSVQDEIVLST